MNDVRMLSWAYVGKVLAALFCILYGSAITLWVLGVRSLEDVRNISIE